MTTLDVLRRLATEQARNRALAVGAGVSLAWLLLVGLFALLAPGDESQGLAGWLVWLVGVLLPLGLIWLAVWFARSLMLLRQEAHALRAELAQMQDPSGAEAPRPAAAAPSPTRRAAAQPAAPRAADSRQVALELDAPEPPRLTPVELFHALNFPDGPEDREAIRSLRLALADPDLARLIRAAQDVVTLLAAQGVYMDELGMAEADPALWRRFAGGQRGAAVAALAVIRDPQALATAGGMMRGDEVFRDVAHHFLRHFDRLLASRADEGDATFPALLAESRSGRAFTLLAQVTGMLGRDESAGETAAEGAAASDERVAG